MSLFFVTAALWLINAILPVGSAPPLSARRAPRTELRNPCSRSLSRIVRQRFTSHVRKRRGGDDRQTPWPDACPFNPQVDLFGWHEKNKSRQKSGEWECAYSKKMFKNEHYIDLHLEKLFMQEAPENGACLADYCEVFGFCNVTEPTFMETFAAEPASCDPEKLEKQKAICHDVIDRCVPEDHSENSANAHFQKNWCEQHTCEARAARHAHNRTWCIVIAIIAALFCLGIFFLCVCVNVQEDPDPRLNRKLKGPGAGGPGIPRRGIPKDPKDPQRGDALRARNRPQGQAPPVDAAPRVDTYGDPDIDDIMPTQLNRHKYE